MEYKGLQSTEEDKKNSIRVSARGIVFLVLIMVGIRLIIAFTAGAGWIETREKTEVDSAGAILENNKQLTLKEKDTDSAEIARLPLMVYVDIVDYKDGSLTVLVDNQSGLRSVLKKVYRLETEEEGEWIELAAVGAGGKAEKEEPETIQLEDLDSQQLVIDLNSFGKLVPGKYRITVDTWSAEFELAENRTE